MLGKVAAWSKWRGIRKVLLHITDQWHSVLHEQIGLTTWVLVSFLCFSNLDCYLPLVADQWHSVLHEQIGLTTWVLFSFLCFSNLDCYLPLVANGQLWLGMSTVNSVHVCVCVCMHSLLVCVCEIYIILPGFNILLHKCCLYMLRLVLVFWCLTLKNVCFIVIFTECFKWLVSQENNVCVYVCVLWSDWWARRIMCVCVCVCVCVCTHCFFLVFAFVFERFLAPCFTELLMFYCKIY